MKLFWEKQQTDRVALCETVSSFAFPRCSKFVTDLRWLISVNTSECSACCSIVITKINTGHSWSPSVNMHQCEFDGNANNCRVVIYCVPPPTNNNVSQTPQAEVFFFLWMMMDNMIFHPAQSFPWCQFLELIPFPTNTDIFFSYIIYIYI